MEKYKESSVSHEWIYQYIYTDKKAGGVLHKHLRCQKKRRKRYGSNERRGKIPNRVSIEQRPAIVEERKRLGDWEADTMIGKKSPYALVTLVERKSRFTLLKKIDQRTAAATRMAIIQMLTPYRTKTLTIPVTTGKNLPITRSLPKNWMLMYTLLMLTPLGKGDQMKIQMDFPGSISRKEVIFQRSQMIRCNLLRSY